MTDLSYELFVIGAGGTGSDFLRTASRFLMANEKGKKIQYLHIIDGDIVEEKNLTRQCFMKEDIGLNKAVVMADILTQSFGLRWLAFPHYLTTVEQLLDLMHKDCIPIIIGCVDNHACRKMVEDCFYLLENCIYYDAANEESSGQIVFATKFKNMVVSKPRSHYFPDIFDGDLRNVEEISCEELNNVAPQHIVTNELSAIYLSAAFTDLIEKGNLRNGIIFFDKENMTSTFIDYRDFYKRQEKRQEVIL